ncbi:MAG: hypothetical protein O7B99_01430, partial [Planctomycetota bacterium]|nr:hypothetical protein [Planctomycetota bacterium]
MGRGRRVAPASRGGRASAGAIYLLLPLLIFAYAAIWLARNTPGSTWEGGREIELEELDAPESMRGLRGELELPGGARLLAQLTPLHAAEAWQAFDARALAERLELGPGEPWRLELWLEDASGGESVAVADARV